MYHEINVVGDDDDDDKVVAEVEVFIHVMDIESSFKFIFNNLSFDTVMLLSILKFDDETGKRERGSNMGRNDDIRTRQVVCNVFV